MHHKGTFFFISILTLLTLMSCIEHYEYRHIYHEDQVADAKDIRKGDADIQLSELPELVDKKDVPQPDIGPDVADLKDLAEPDIGPDVADLKDLAEPEIAPDAMTGELLDVSGDAPEIEDVIPEMDIEPEADWVEPDACVPDCMGKMCGDDGCGGLCGDCVDGTLCTADNLCIAESCHGMAVDTAQCVKLGDVAVPLDYGPAATYELTLTAGEDLTDGSPEQVVVRYRTEAGFSFVTLTPESPVAEISTIGSTEQDGGDWPVWVFCVDPELSDNNGTLFVGFDDLGSDMNHTVELDVTFCLDLDDDTIPLEVNEPAKYLVTVESIDEMADGSPPGVDILYVGLDGVNVMQVAAESLVAALTTFGVPEGEGWPVWVFCMDFDPEDNSGAYAVQFCLDCTPDCTDKECGDDGCGDVCGECASDKECEDGICKDCQPGCMKYPDSDIDAYGASEGAVCSCGPLPGYVEEDGDCDDGNKDVNPGLSEDCATVGVDDNCDGSTSQEGALNCKMFYKDADEDGYGVAESVCACEPDDQFTADNVLDCCDEAPKAYPGQTKYFSEPVNWCGGYDYNCDQVEETQYNSSCVEPPCSAGWFEPKPACGVTANWCLNCSGCGSCIGQTIQQKQKCR